MTREQFSFAKREAQKFGVKYKAAHMWQYRGVPPKWRYELLTRAVQQGVAATWDELGEPLLKQAPIGGGVVAP